MGEKREDFLLHSPRVCVCSAVIKTTEEEMDGIKREQPISSKKRPPAHHRQSKVETHVEGHCSLDKKKN